MSLKALADAVLARNRSCNKCATDPEKPRNKQPPENPVLLHDLLHAESINSGKPDTADPDQGRTVGKVANSPDAKRRGPADDRIDKMVANLASDPGLRYAMETHLDIDPDAVILTLAIRGKGACELRIPKSRYDATVLLEMIQKHTTRETLQ